MARTVRDANLETRTARGRLKARGKPYYRAIEPGLHLGYRRPLVGAGKWVARHYIGGEAYQVETLATADDYSDADGVAILSYRQAQAKARERMVARAHHAVGKHGPLTVRDALEAHLEYLQAHRKSAYDARCKTEAHILAPLGDIELQALTTEQLRKWHVALAKLPGRARTEQGAKQRYRKYDGSAEGIRRRQASANRVLTTLKAALNFAWREGRTPSDAAWRRVQPFKGVDAARVRYLTIEQCRRLINACDPVFRPLVEAALATGARYGELSRLTAGDFNPDTRTLSIRTSKTGKSRHVVLTDEGAAAFQRWCAGRSDSDLLFVRDDGQPWRIPNQDRRIRVACKRARIVPPISFHCLRHTYASLAVMNGAPLLVAAKNLGHTDTRMVERHYGHMAESYVADAIRKSAPTFGIKADRKVMPIR